ncbi:MAG: 3-oxo-tetronate kinase [Acetobacteraceae bacterium]
MSLRLGCIADDYTGASDLANTLSRQGLATVQTIGVPRPGFALPVAGAVVVALKIRAVPAAEAVARALDAAAWLRARGAAHLMYKICSTFDSTDAGNIGPVTEALAAAYGAACVPVTPAFPETGRTVFQGHLFVGRVPLDESPLREHPLNPMRDADLVRVLARQSTSAVGLVPFATVEEGPEAIGRALAACARAGERAAIVDAVAERHLRALGEAAFKLPVSTGASGLGLGLAHAARGGAEAAAETPAFAPVPGPSAILAGSCSAATLGQIAAIEGVIPVRRLEAGALADGEGVAEALAWARARLADGPVLLASSAPPAEVAALQAAHGGRAGAPLGARIEAALAAIARGLAEAGVRRLIVAGGETAGAIVDALGIEGFEIGAEIAPGVPLLRSIEARPRLFALKSGNFGGPDFFARALAAMGVSPARGG